MIQFDHLTKTYSGINAVDDLTTEIRDGEIYGLLGPNGAGKSTTILMLTGLIEPTAGRCLVAGIDVTQNPVGVKERIGYMPEDVGFYANLSAEENLDYFARLYRMDRGREKTKIADLLSLVGLDGITKDVGGYSKGMRQRLGLAKALLNDPSVIVLDEPTANLDPQGVADYRRIITDVAGRGTTVFVSSHILAEVSRICTRVGILARGRLVAEGSVQELAGRLHERPDHRTVIRIGTRLPMPVFEHDSIMGAAYSDDRCSATLTATEDLRDFIADYLASYGIQIRELFLEENPLEETFLSYYQEAS
ncbi:MAG: ABC transporter ATP-binding protein [Methanoregula sp.]|jgi:ABC-2 type transport system ATP-binding protein